MQQKTANVPTRGARNLFRLNNMIDKQEANGSLPEMDALFPFLIW